MSLASHHDYISLLSLLQGHFNGPSAIGLNLVIFKLDLKKHTPEDWCKLMEEEGVLMFPFGHDMVRMVTHLHITDNDIDKVINIYKKYWN